MPEERLRAMAEVDELVLSGEIEGFGQWQQLVRHPPDPGVKALEGSELEGDLEEGERAWLDDDEQKGLWAEEAEILALEAESPSEGTALAIVASDEAVAQARRLVPA